MPKIIQDILLLAWLRSYPDFRRNPFTILMLGTVGAIPLFFMSVIGNGNVLAHGLVGAIVSSVAFGSVLGPIQSVASDRYVKMREMLVTMPVDPVSYALGTAVRFLLLSFPSVVLFVVIAISLGFLNPVTFLWTALTLLAAWATMSTIGFLISTYLNRTSDAMLSSLANLLGFGFVFIPPVFFPESLLGEFGPISVLIPTSNAAGLIRTYMELQQISTEIAVARWVILILTMVAAIVLTSRKARWRET